MLLLGLKNQQNKITMIVNLKPISPFADYQQFSSKATEANKLLHNGTGAGSDFLGWVDLPGKAIKQVKEINAITQDFGGTLDCIVVIGIGGSYLGAKAVISALRSQIDGINASPEILFAGHHLSQSYHQDLILHLKSKNWGIVVISKSGTTTEPAIAFRLLRAELIRQFGNTESRKRIIAITDKSKGALRSLTDSEGYTSFNIPDDVGGRFSVLTPVGLVPIALAGINISDLVEGAVSVMTQSGQDIVFEENLSAQYAAARYALYQANKKVEILSNFNPALHFIGEWWKQLFGESEGKGGKGIFPASVDLTTDLHSMGQYIQDGERMIFETCLLVNEGKGKLSIPMQETDLDQLNYLNGKNLDYVNHQAAEGTILAHYDGGVPIIRLEINELSAFTIGEIFYFFEKACGISGYMLGVNPFDQPGVEDYKKNMFALLGKKGFEEETKKLISRIKG